MEGTPRAPRSSAAWVAAAVVASCALAPGVARGGPITARALKMDVIPAYGPCTASDTQTNSGLPACLAPALTDPLCRFGPLPKGKIKMLAFPTDVTVTGTLAGVEPACEGQTLELIASFRITTEDCPPAAFPAQNCTLVDLVDLPIGSCTVTEGRCAIAASLNTAPSLASAPFPVVGANKRTHVRLLGCGYRRTTGSAPPGLTFTCGVKVP